MLGRNRRVFSVLMVCLLMQSISVVKAASVAERCAEAVARIRSYDVTYSLESLTYPPLEAPSGPNAEKADKSPRPTPYGIVDRRDVLAFGLGRRFENNLANKDYFIRVLDWQTAGLRENLTGDNRVGRSAIFSSMGNGAGEGYFDYFNPNCGGFFLADLLRDKGSTVRALDASSANGLVGIEVSNPQFHEFFGPFRVWVDPNHGDMPSIIETDRAQEQGKRVLDTRTEVKEFLQLGDGAWVPVKGTYENLLIASLRPDYCHRGASLVVNVEKSSWNSIDSDHLFTEASLPAVNNVVKVDGFKAYYPPAIAASYKRAEEGMNRAMAQTLTEGKASRLMPLVGGISALILLTALFVVRRYRRHRNLVAK